MSSSPPLHDLHVRIHGGRPQGAQFHGIGDHDEALAYLVDPASVALTSF